MEYIYNDIDFINIIEPILKNKNFIKTQTTIHHGISKLDHSIKVAYYSYNLAKRLNLDYISVARAGILHDFYFSTCEGKSLSKDAINLTFRHHNIALDNALHYFKLNDLEKDIIVKHMFPFVIRTIPKYKESFLVAFVDKVIGTYEALCKIKKLANTKVLSKVLPGLIITTGILK
jgi:uncharacterized protein